MMKKMDIKFGLGNVMINRSNNTVNLNELIKVGNIYRKERGLREVSVSDYLRRPESWEFIFVLDNKYGETPQLKREANGAIAYAELVENTSLINSKRGRYGGTYADLYIALDVASWLSPDFRLEVYKVFVEQKILDKRKDGIELYKEFTSTLKKYISDITVIDYASVAKAINRKVNGHFVAGWDIASATASKQERRNDILKTCISLLKLRLVRSVEGLNSLISQLPEE